MRKIWIILAVLVAFALVGPVGALPITFSDAGTLHIKFISSDAAYDNSFGIVSPYSQPLGMNHATSPGTEWTFGHIGANVPVILSLSVTNQNRKYVSDPPASNPDNREHISITVLSGGVKQVGWEDTFNGGDNDKNDVILNVWVVPDPKLTLVKTVINDNGGTKQVSDFTLKIDGGQVTSGIPNVVTPGAHTASEVQVSGYSASAWSGDCDANGAVTLSNGENKVCYITNNDIAPGLTLDKIVVNDNGGTELESAWTLTADGTTINDLFGPGAATHTDVTGTVNADTFALSESTGPAGYTKSDWSCTGFTNGGSNTATSVTLKPGENVVCTITNTYTRIPVPPKLIVIKHVDNTAGGSLAANDFLITVTGSSPIPASFNGAENPGTNVAINAGSYSVKETTQSGYVASYSSDCSGEIKEGDAKTCTITNVYTSVPVPEFPTVALPAALIIGMLGAVLFIQRIKEN